MQPGIYDVIEEHYCCSYLLFCLLLSDRQLRISQDVRQNAWFLQTDAGAATREPPKRIDEQLHASMSSHSLNCAVG